MIEDKNTNHPEGCRCMMCYGYGHHGRHHFIWWLVKIAIIIIVFWVGVKVGEFKSLLGYSWGYPGGGFYNMRTMMGNVPYGQNLGYGPGMMGGWYWSSATTTQK